MKETLTIQAVRGEEFPRNFTKGITNFGDWAQIEPHFVTLEQEIEQIRTAEKLEAWLLRQSELDATLDEEYSRRYIANT